MEGKEMIPKFRAWDKEDESWIDIKSLGMMEGEITILEEWDDDLPYFIEDLGKTWELIQSTGLHDKNGKEIFEGDILKSPYGFIGKVNIVEGAWYVQHSDFTNNHFLYVAQGKSVIIGNIHEHSHLLDNGGHRE